MSFVEYKTSGNLRFQSQYRKRFIVKNNCKLRQYSSVKIFASYNNNSGSTNHASYNNNGSTNHADQQLNHAQNFSRWLTRYLGLSRNEVTRLQARNDALFRSEFISQQNKVDLLRDQLEINRNQVGRMLLKFPKLLGLTDSNLEKKLYYWLYQVGCQPNAIINNPAVLSRSISSCKETVQFLKMLGINHPVKLIRKFPLIASLKREGLKIKIDNYAQLLNIDHDKACEMVEEQPELLGLKDTTIQQKFKGLKTVLQVKDDAVIQQAIWRQPQLLCMNTATIKKSAKWFWNKGVAEENFSRIVRYAPSVLLLTDERREENWQSVLNMGVEKDLLLKVFSMQGSYFGINWTGSTQQLKVHFANQYLGLSVEKVLEVCPMYFTCSLMYRIAPRVMYMKSIGGIQMRLNNLLVPSNQLFEKQYPEFKKFYKQFQKNEWPKIQQELEIEMQKEQGKQKQQQ